MKNTVEAIKYGIQTLGVSPEEMFSLIESSEGYTGEDYSRWLAGKIIELAEKDGVGYTQLLVKKFAITQSIMEECSDDSISEEWIGYFREMLGCGGTPVYTDGIEGVGTELEDIDWFTGVDLDELNGDFAFECLPEGLYSCIENGSPVTVFCKLTNDAVDRGSELFKVAKNGGINCKTTGALMLYRMCNLLSAYDTSMDDFKFAFICNTKFLYNKDNADAIKYFLSYYKYTGFTVNASELLTESYLNSEFAVVVCSPRGLGDATMDGFCLPEAVLRYGVIEYGEVKRYSKSDIDMLTCVKSRAPELTDKVVGLSGEEFVLTEGVADALGYLWVDRYGVVRVVSDPVVGSVCIPICRSNFMDCVVYYGVSKSLERFGMARGITDVLTGHESFMELYYNCLPLFLFDTDNLCRDCGVVRLGLEDYRLANRISISNKFIAEELGNGEVQFSFEAKQVLDICKGFLEYVKGMQEQVFTGGTFEDIRKEADNEELNKQYLFAINGIKDFIVGLYRKME